jgi:hypothetical protein
MDEFRMALIISRIAGSVLFVIGGCWFFAWGSMAIHDWVQNGFLSPQGSSLRLAWITDGVVYWGAGVVVMLLGHRIARFATKP